MKLAEKGGEKDYFEKNPPCALLTEVMFFVLLSKEMRCMSSPPNRLLNLLSCFSQIQDRCKSASKSMSSYKFYESWQTERGASLIE